MKILALAPVLALPVLLTTNGIANEAKSLPDLADLPVAVTSFGATFHDDAIYVYGGHLGRAHKYNWESVNKPLYRLQFTEGAEWEELASDEPALGPALWTHKSGVIRIGGMQPRNSEGEEQNLVSVPLVRLFDPASGEWSALPDLPAPRSSHDAWISGDKIYVVGGWEMRGEGNSNRWHKTVEVLDLAETEPSWTSIEQPFIRRALAVAILGEELFCMGGLDNGGDTSDEVDILNLKANEWRKGPRLPDTPMHGFGLTAMVDEDDGKLYITGFDGKIHTYAGEDGWVEVGQFEHGRMFGRLVDPPNAPVVVMGGAGADGRPSELEYAILEEE